MQHHLNAVKDEGWNKNKIEVQQLVKDVSMTAIGSLQQRILIPILGGRKGLVCVIAKIWLVTTLTKTCEL